MSSPPRDGKDTALAIVAGIDEAGFGPVLGPLVVSAAAFDVPDELAAVSLWELLAAAVCRKPSRKKLKIAIDDSKKLFSGQKAGSLQLLERGVLSMLAQLGELPGTLGELAGLLSPSATEPMAAYPWYHSADLAIPRCVAETDIRLARNSLQAAMDSAGVRMAGMRCEVVFAGEFNRRVAATNNKSSLLFDVTGCLLLWLWRASPGGRLTIVVDRHGGRMRYLPALQRLFDGCSFKILEEADRLSAYRIASPERQADILFLTEADRRQLPAALASMTGKYVRELFMEMLNAYWTRQVPGLAPTAGYYTDGRRFFDQIGPAVRRLRVPENMLYRSR